MTTEKTKQELLDEAWEEFDIKINPFRKEREKRLCEIESRFKDKCEVCGK